MQSGVLDFLGRQYLRSLPIRVEVIVTNHAIIIDALDHNRFTLGLRLRRLLRIRFSALSDRVEVLTCTASKKRWLAAVRLTSAFLPRCAGSQASSASPGTTGWCP